MTNDAFHKNRMFNQMFSKQTFSGNNSACQTVRFSVVDGTCEDKGFYRKDSQSLIKSGSAQKATDHSEWARFVVTESEHCAGIIKQKQHVQHSLTRLSALTQVSKALYEAICSGKMWTIISSARVKFKNYVLTTGTEELFKARGRLPCNELKKKGTMPGGDRPRNKRLQLQEKSSKLDSGKTFLIVKITRTLEEISQRLNNFCI